MFQRIKELEQEEKGQRKPNEADQNAAVGRIVERNPVSSVIEEEKKPEKVSKFKQDMMNKKSS